MYRECYVATKYLSRSHSEFMQLSSFERKKMLMYLEVVNKKERNEIEKMDRNSGVDMSDAPKVMR